MFHEQFRSYLSIYKVTFIYGPGRTIYTFFFCKMRNQLRPNHLIFLLNMAFLTNSTRIIIIFIVIAPQSDRNHLFSSDFQWHNCLFLGRGLLWSFADMQLTGVDMANGKTLYAIHRRRWPHSGVEQMDGRTLERGWMDVTFLAHSWRKRKITMQRLLGSRQA